jgi:hypothetical protein
MACYTETPTRNGKRGKKASPAKQHKRQKSGEGNSSDGESDSDDEQYEVSAILARRGEGSKVEYLVCWEVSTQ